MLRVASLNESPKRPRWDLGRVLDEAGDTRFATPGPPRFWVGGLSCSSWPKGDKSGRDPILGDPILDDALLSGVAW